MTGPTPSGAPAPSDPREARPGRVGIRTQLFLLLTVCSLGPLFISNTVGYVRSRDHLVDLALRDLRNVAALEAERTVAFVDARRRLVSSIAADNQHLSGLVHRLGRDDGDARARAALHEHLAAKAAESPDIQALMALDARGRVVGSAPAGAVEAPRRCALWRGGAAEVIGLADGAEKPGLWVAAPIHEPDVGRVGTLCSRHRFDIGPDLRAARAERTPRGALHLLDAAGGLIASATDGVGGAEPPRFSEPPPAPGPWAGRRSLEDGRDVIAAFAPIPQLGWGMLVSVPVGEALAELDRLKWQVLSLSAVLVAVLAFVITLTSRALTRRLRGLARAAARLSEGRLGERVPTGGPREVAELARAFNHMSAALHDAHALLEERIADRTRELRRSQAFTELLLDSVERWVVVVDRELRIVKANAEARRLFGEALEGRPYYEALHGLDAPPDGCPVLEALETGRPASAEVSRRVDAGPEIVDLDAYPMIGPEGRVESVAQIGRVVTDRRAAQAQMIHHEKMAAFGLLAAGVAHEIGNPLAAIKSQIQVSRRADDPARVRQALELVEREVDRMGRLLRELVDFARRRRDRVTLISINQVVQDVVRLLSHDPRARRVQIRTDLGRSLPAVRAREDDLVQVLFNLGVNALDALGGAGTLSYATADGDGRVVVRVTDTGPGIPPELHDKVFEPFFTTKEPNRGTGLGLFVSRGVVERLGGRLELERSGPDGTVFAVTLSDVRTDDH